MNVNLYQCNGDRSTKIFLIDFWELGPQVELIKIWQGIYFISFFLLLGKVANERHRNWTCDLRANERPWNKVNGKGMNIQTYNIRTWRLLDWPGQVKTFLESYRLCIWLDEGFIVNPSSYTFTIIRYTAHCTIHTEHCILHTLHTTQYLSVHTLHT